MGTKIQANAFFPKNHPVIDLNSNTNNGFGSLSNNLITRTGQDPDPLMTRVYQNSYSVYNMENVRQTILSQESIFKNQLQELHRVYRRQWDLMNEIKTRDVKNAPVLTLDSVSNKHFEPSSNGNDRGLSLSVGVRSVRTRNEHLLDGLAGHFQGRRSDERFSTREFYSAKSPMLFGSSLVARRNEILFSQLQTIESLRKERKIFGVEISEGNYDSGNGASILSTTLPRKDASNSESFWKKESTKPYTEMHNHVEPSSLNCNHLLQNLEFGGKNVDTRLREDEKTDLSCTSRLCGRANANGNCVESDNSGNCKGGLPWFLKNTQHNGERSKGVEHPYFMNLDSLRNCSEQFITKSETEIQSSMQKHEMSAPTDDNEIKKGENDASNQFKTRDLTYESSLRYQIDLNLSLDEQDVPTAMYIPAAIVKIATTEIDLKAPEIIEAVPDTSHKEVNSRQTEVSRDKSEISSEERDKSAADALICLSLFGEKIKTDNDSCKLKEATLTDSLYWFAEVISSQCINSSNESIDNSIPEGMDYFEFMTLKLEDVKDEHSLYNNSMVLNVKRDEKMGQGGTICKGPRKRVRQQKNFKRDVLPGLVTLSRHEMKEDLKAFEEIRKGECHLWKSINSIKKGRGRKRSTSPSSAVSVTELRLVDGSLVGWGKRTKRLPRKRCRNMSHSFLVKC